MWLAYLAYIYSFVIGVPLHYSLEREIAETVGETLLSQFNISPAGDAGEHHHQGWALLTPSPRIRAMTGRARHGWRRWVGTSWAQVEKINELTKLWINNCKKNMFCFTWSQHTVNRPLLSFGSGPTTLARRARARGGGRGVGLWGEVRRRVAICH